MAVVTGYQMSTHETAIATRLASVGVGTLGTDIFTGPVRPSAQQGIPTQATFVLQLAGVAPSLTLSGGAELAFIDLQVRVRSAQDQYASGQALAQSCYDGLHAVSLSGYVACLAVSSAPLYIGTDEQGAHGWTITITLTQRREYGN